MATVFPFMRRALTSAPATSNSWTRTGRMAAARDGFTATLLPDGTVLAAGGGDPYAILASAEVYDPVTGTWSGTEPMSTLRDIHVAARLNDGRVLVAGGFNGGGVLASAELYDAAAGTWTTTVSMATPRSFPVSTLLNDGRFLVAGGAGPAPGTLIATAEVYDPLAASASTPDGRWTAAGSMSTPRLGATLTLLPDGTALAAGGRSGNHGAASVLASTELYDPGTGTWSARAGMRTPRTNHSATLLNDGTVFVTGGFNGGVALASSELYDPGAGPAGTWSAAASMMTPRGAPAGVALTDGRVLVVCGDDPASPLATAEVYDPPPKDKWETPTIPIGRRQSAIAILLRNGDVLVTGGGIGNTGLTDALSSAELFRP